MEAAVKLGKFQSEPPERASAHGRGRPPSGKYAEVAADLRRNRGQWAPILGARPQLADAIIKGRLYDFRPAGAYDAMVRSGKVWVTYKGGRPRKVRS